MNLGDEIQLKNHLSYNFVPAIPQAYKAACAAIDAVNDGRSDYPIKTPSGNLMTAAEVCEELHLEYFIEESP